MNRNTSKIFKVAYLNIHGQSNLTETKQVQIEDFAIPKPSSKLKAKLGRPYCQLEAAAAAGSPPPVLFKLLGF